MSAKIYRDRLFYESLIIEDGDEVLVEYREPESTTSGIVTAFSSSEVR